MSPKRDSGGEVTVLAKSCPRMESMIRVGDVVERSVGHTPAGGPCRDVGGELPVSNTGGGNWNRTAA